MTATLKFLTLTALSLLLSGVLIFTYSAEVQARKSKSKSAVEVLPPGGKTIGGPGFYDSSTLLHRIYGGPSTSICVTVTNVGKNEIKFQPTPTGGDLVFPDETTTRCYADTNHADLACQGSEGTCKAYWRVDSM